MWLTLACTVLASVLVHSGWSRPSISVTVAAPQGSSFGQYVDDLSRQFASLNLPVDVNFNVYSLSDPRLTIELLKPGGTDVFWWADAETAPDEAAGRWNCSPLVQKQHIPTDTILGMSVGKGKTQLALHSGEVSLMVQLSCDSIMKYLKRQNGGAMFTGTGNTLLNQFGYHLGPLQEKDRIPRTLKLTAENISGKRSDAKSDVPVENSLTFVKSNEEGLTRIQVVVAEQSGSTPGALVCGSIAKEDHGFRSMACSLSSTAASDALGPKALFQTLLWLAHKRSVYRVASFINAPSSGNAPIQLHNANPEMYTVKDSIDVELHLEELKLAGEGFEFVPLVLQQDVHRSLGKVKLHLGFLGPHSDYELVPDSKCNCFKTALRLPDHHGIYKFTVAHSIQGYNSIAAEMRVTVRNLKHDEYPRFLPVAYPYYLSIFLAMSVFFSWALFIARQPGKEVSRLA